VWRINIDNKVPTKFNDLTKLRWRYNTLIRSMIHLTECASAHVAAMRGVSPFTILLYWWETWRYELQWSIHRKLLCHILSKLRWRWRSYFIVLTKISWVIRPKRMPWLPPHSISLWLFRWNLQAALQPWMTYWPFFSYKPDASYTATILMENKLDPILVYRSSLFRF
jgi:hypothetical protein